MFFIIINKLTIVYFFIGGLDIYMELMQRFPNNIHILLEIAKVSIFFFKFLIILLPYMLYIKVQASSFYLL